MPLPIALLGASGKMGQCLHRLVSENPSFILTDLAQCAVIIDFSHFSATSKHLATAMELDKPLVLGTTGHSQELIDEIHAAATHIPLFFSSNFATGISLCTTAIEQIARAFADQCTISIFETHHVHKKDTPSGTALTLARATGRDVAIHSSREGEVVGEHRVVFSCNGETIEIKHQAHSRDVFGYGALRAAQFLASQPPGLYFSI